MSKVSMILIYLLYALSIFTVVATKQLSGYENFLKEMTVENGFFETISVLLLFSIFLYGVSCFIRNRNILSRLTLFYILSFSLIAFLAGMEEISWGQQIFHFQSNDYFLEQNLQQETNLHNLIDANIFSSIIYSSIYTLFVFIPLFYKLSKSYLKSVNLLKHFDINPHTILVVLFASVFQLYFYNDIGVVVDALTHLFALMLFGYFLFIKRGDIWLKIHFIFIVLATIVSAYHYKIYSFFNMQYEIRESFVVLSALLIFIELIKKEKDEKSSMDNR